MKYKALLFSLFATANLFAQHPAIHFEIETDQPCQTMDYFGASDCWSMQFIGLWRLSGNFWLVSFKISYLCLPLFYETRTTPSCHPSGCAYRQL